MEILAVIVIIIVLALVLGVKPIVIVFSGGVLLSVVILLTSLLFVFFFIQLISSKKHPARFSRIDKRPNGKFKVAYYIIDGKEYPNVFPEEGIFSNKLYKENTDYNVYLNKKGYVFDRFSVATCTIGFSVSLVIIFLAVTLMRNIPISQLYEIITNTAS